MKTTILNCSKIIVAILTLAIFAGCRKPTADLEYEVNTSQLYKAPTLLHFVNANPDSPTDLPASFNVEISGKDAALVVTNTGTRSFKVVEGFLPLALLPSSSPSETNPIIFNIYAEISGYAPITQSFIITNDDPTPHEIAVTEYAHPPKGTSVLIKSSTIANGVAGNDITLNTSTNADMSEASSIKITSGTEMRDADSNIIHDNTLTSRIIHYGTQHKDALNAFPGGFAPIIEGIANPTFVTSGLMAIRMNVGNKQVKRFSQPITVTMEVSNYQKNPANANVQPGDTIPVWSMDEKTGIWKREGPAMFTQNTSGKLQLQFQMTHLSLWNFDWWVTPCGATLRVNVKTPSWPDYRQRCKIELATPLLEHVMGYTYDVVYNGYSNSVPRVPNIPLAKFMVLSMGGSKLGESAPFNPCTKGSAEVIINPTTFPIITINLKVRAVCTNRNAAANFSDWVSIRKTTESYYTYVYVKDGNTSLQLENNKDYVVKAYYDGVLYTATGRFAAGNNPFASSNGFSGQTTYDAASKILNADFSYNVNCK